MNFYVKHKFLDRRIEHQGSLINNLTQEGEEGGNKSNNFCRFSKHELNENLQDRDQRIRK